MSISRLVRWNIILSPYVYSIEFKKGSEIEADALSRLTLPDQTNVEVVINSFNLVDEIPLSKSEIKFHKKGHILCKVKQNILRGWRNPNQDI